MSNSKNNKDEVNINKLYGTEATLSKEDFIKTYHINPNGLSSEEASKRIQKYGFNQVTSTKPKKWYNYFLESLFSPFNSILLRNCCNTFLYRCLFSTYTKLCKYYCYFYSCFFKYSIRIF